jgi:hypothetical protein
VVTYAFEDQVPEDSWSAFGFNTQNKALMVPSDVVLTTATTAVDYYLSDRVSHCCDQSEGRPASILFQHAWVPLMVK